MPMPAIIMYQQAREHILFFFLSFLKVLLNSIPDFIYETPSVMMVRLQEEFYGLLGRLQDESTKGGDVRQIHNNGTTAA
jgi:hypothetical protein